MQSYANALYFSNSADHPDPDKDEKRRSYENLLEEKLKSGEKIYPSVMAKLRITQGDILFSKCFKRREDPLRSSREYQYIHRGATTDIRTLRKMLRYYVEACNFMAQHGSIDFASAVRVLRRRIELIADRPSLQQIQRGLHHLWTDQEYLKKKPEEMETLVKFARIRSMTIKDENDKQKTK